MACRVFALPLLSVMKGEQARQDVYVWNGSFLLGEMPVQEWLDCRTSTC